MKRRGFTLLEVLIATTIMALAVTGLLSNLRTSLLNASKLTDYERAAALARSRMDELLAADRLPKNAPFAGIFPPQATGGMEAGWRALATNFEGMGDSPSPGTRILERVQLEVWWGAPENRKTMLVTGYRSVQMKAEDMGAFGQMSLEPPK
jgi:general secretion pathway protein I